MAIEVEKDVPFAELDDKIAIANMSGAIKVDSVMQDDKLYTITAHYKDEDKPQWKIT